VLIESFVVIIKKGSSTMNFNQDNLIMYLNACGVLADRFNIIDVSMEDEILYEITANNEETVQEILQQVARPSTNLVIMGGVEVWTKVIRMDNNIITIKILL
jgi:hypothetical protein